MPTEIQFLLLFLALPMVLFLFMAGDQFLDTLCEKFARWLRGKLRR